MSPHLVIWIIFVKSLGLVSLGLKCLPSFVDIGLLGWDLKYFPPFVDVGLFGWGLKYLVGRIWDCDVAATECPLCSQALIP